MSISNRGFASMKDKELHEHKFYAEQVVIESEDNGAEKMSYVGHAYILCETCGQMRKVKIINS